MSVAFNRIENRLESLRKIDPTCLDLVDRISYYIEFREVMLARRSFLLNAMMYKTASNIQNEIVDIQNKIDLLKDFLVDSEAKAIEEHIRFGYLGLEKIHGDLTISEIRANIKNIYFGLPIELRYDGYGFFIEQTIQNNASDKAMEALKMFAKENKFTLSEKKLESKDCLYIKISK